jgi:hypothetical protein
MYSSRISDKVLVPSNNQSDDDFMAVFDAKHASYLHGRLSSYWFVDASHRASSCRSRALEPRQRHLSSTCGLGSKPRSCARLR